MTAKPEVRRGLRFLPLPQRSKGPSSLTKNNFTIESLISADEAAIPAHRRLPIAAASTTHDGAGDGATEGHSPPPTPPDEARRWGRESVVWSDQVQLAAGRRHELMTSYLLDGSTAGVSWPAVETAPTLRRMVQPCSYQPLYLSVICSPVMHLAQLGLHCKQLQHPTSSCIGSSSWVTPSRRAYLHHTEHSSSTVSSSPYYYNNNNGGRRQSRRRQRTAFSADQLGRLDAAFTTHRYLVGHDRTQLAASLNLSETQVKVWFQNRRTKDKRQQFVASAGHDVMSMTSSIDSNDVDADSPTHVTAV